MHGAFSGVPNVRGVASAMNEPSTSEKTVRTHQGARLSLTSLDSHHHHQPDKRLFTHIGEVWLVKSACAPTKCTPKKVWCTPPWRLVHIKEGLVHTKWRLVHTKEGLLHTIEGLVHTTMEVSAHQGGSGAHQMEVSAHQRRVIAHHRGAGAHHHGSGGSLRLAWWKVERPALHPKYWRCQWLASVVIRWWNWNNWNKVSWIFFDKNSNFLAYNTTFSRNNQPPSDFLKKEGPNQSCEIY